MIRQIKYFLAIVRCKSFTEAADECNISQSAMSQQIKALEQELGVRLLNRENRKISLTPAGEYFWHKSTAFIDEFEHICSETRRIADNERAVVSIGCLKNYVGPEVRAALADFSAKWANVDVRIATGSHEDLYEALKREYVDIAVSDQRRKFSNEYINVVLSTEPCRVELSSHNPLAAKTAIEVEDLRDIPCIIIATDAQRDSERFYWQSVVGLESDVLFADSLDEARLLASGGKGYVPTDGDGDAGASLVRMPIMKHGAPVMRTLCAFWKADNSGYYIEDFADILKTKFLAQDAVDSGGEA